MTYYNRIQVHLRHLIRRDMPEVLEAERQSFSKPLTERELLVVLRKRNVLAVAAEYRDKVLGYMMYELFKHEICLLHIVVKPVYRRLDIGSQLVARVVSKLSEHGRFRVYLGVRETNLPAQLFFRSQGFSAIKVLRNFYTDTNEDCYFMEHLLTIDTSVPCHHGQEAQEELQ